MARGLFTFWSVFLFPWPLPAFLVHFFLLSLSPLLLILIGLRSACVFSDIFFFYFGVGQTETRHMDVMYVGLCTYITDRYMSPLAIRMGINSIFLSVFFP